MRTLSNKLFDDIISLLDGIYSRLDLVDDDQAEYGFRITKMIARLEEMPLEADPVTLEFRSVEEAEETSLALADLLCWHRGFAAAREHLDTTNSPMGVEKTSWLNGKIKKAIEQHG